MTAIEKRAKRMIETPLASRVMLPTFGSKLYELVDKEISQKYRLQFIAYTFEAFFDVNNNRLWDNELEPQQIIIDKLNDTELRATVILSNGEELKL